MSGLDKDRYRNRTVSFRVSAEESILLEARIIASGLPKGEFMLKSLLKKDIHIRAGKFYSDRLSLELRRLRQILEETETDGQHAVLLECRTLLKTLCVLVEGKDTKDE